MKTNKLERNTFNMTHKANFFDLQRYHRKEKKSQSIQYNKGGRHKRQLREECK